MSIKKITFAQGTVFLILFLLKVILLSSCGVKENVNKMLHGEEESKNVSSSNKTDTIRYYYPVQLGDKSNSVTSGDTSMLSTFSGSLLFAREPVLHSFNGHDVYRMLIFGGKSTIKIISLHKEKDKVWLSAKELSRPAFIAPQKNGRFAPMLNGDGSIDTTAGVSFEEHASIKEMMGGKPELLNNIIHNFSADTWDNMEYEVKRIGLFDLPAYNDNLGKEHIILEVRVNNKYWMVDRDYPNAILKACEEYLLNLVKLSGKSSNGDWGD